MPKEVNKSRDHPGNKQNDVVHVHSPGAIFFLGSDKKNNSVLEAY